MPTLYFIRIPDREQHIRAIEVFLDCRDTRYVYPGRVMAVTEEHIKALEREHIPFEYLYPRNANGQGTAPVQS